MTTTRIVIFCCAIAVACTPKLSGTCSAARDCKSGESCSAEGLCLRIGGATTGGDGDAGDAGNGDAGDAGNGDAGDAGSGDAGDAGNTTTGGSIDILSPAGGAIEKGTFHVSAQASSSVSISGVTFTLTSVANGSVLGHLDVGTASVNTWSGELSVDQAAFGGSADLRAVMHRTGLAEVISAKVTLIVDQNAPSITAAWDQTAWHALDAGFSVAATVADDRSGVASAALVLPDGGTTQATIAGGTATFQLQAGTAGIPGAAAAIPVSLSASDVVGNQILVTSAGSIRVDDQPPGISVQALDLAVWRNGPLDFTATLDDGAGSGLGSASLLINGGFVAGQPDAGGVFTFHTDLSQLPATEGAVALQIVGTDAVGNQADAGVSIAVDNIPPAVISARLDSAPDVTDLAGKGWFKGPTIAPASSAILVSAVVSDTHLSSSSAVVGTHTYAGTLVAGRWNYSIPRSEGLGAGGAVNVTFDAQDAAGNHPVSSPALAIRFDDKKTLTASASNDSSFHGPSQIVTVSVSATAPSGFPLKTGAVDFANTGKLSLGSCSGASAVGADASSTINPYPTASTLVFKVPMSCAPGNTDGPVSFSAAVKSLAGGAGTATGSINVDTQAPVTGDILTLYPATASGPLNWSHDGSHFHRRDNGPLFSFAAYDCHGLSGSLPTITGLPGATVTQAADTRGILNPSGTCAAPGGVTVQRYTVSANLAQVPTSSLRSEDNSLGWSATVSDAFGSLGSGSGAFNVTRRLWQTAPGLALGFLTLGPRLFAASSGNAMYSLDPATGSQGSWAPPSDMPLIAPNGATPALIYAQGSTVYAGNAASGTTSNFGNCFHGDFLDTFGLVDASTAAYTSHTDTNTCPSAACRNADCGGTCCPACFVTTTQSFVDRIQLSGSSVSCVASGSAPGLICGGSPAGPGSLANRVSSAIPAVLYVGLNAGSWFLANAGGSNLDSIASNLPAPGWPLIDGSNPPIAYLPGVAGTPGRIDARLLTAGGFGATPFSLPVFGGAITDMQLAANGILYVLSSNTVYAVITDSSGGATAAGGQQTAAWPSQCRDPCRSSNAGIQCPY